MSKVYVALVGALLTLPLSGCLSDSSDGTSPVTADNPASNSPAGQELPSTDISSDADAPTTSGPRLQPTTPSGIDRTCDEAPYPSKTWTTCESRNFARTLEAPAEQLDLAFQTRYSLQSTANIAEWTARSLADPSWLALRSGNSFLTPLCASYGLPCTGDPYRYAGVSGPDGKQFFDQEAIIEDLVFYDRECARISARLWLPRNATASNPVPGIVITNGSIQAPQTVYYWAAQALVRAGYGVMTYDPRGQGRSDMQTPRRGQGSNLNPRVFWEGQVDAIDFFRASPQRSYPHAQTCANTYRTRTANFNPFWDRIDHSRLGIAGHSLGAIGVSVVQGYGAEGAEPWPGILDQDNPVTAAVGWDSLITPGAEGLATVANLQAPDELYTAITTLITQDALPAFAPRVPSMSLFADYAGVPVPYIAPPDPTTNLAPFRAWQQANVPVYALGFQGTTHFDFSQLPGFPSSSWCADTRKGACRGGWGSPAITYYTLAWFDRWLKKPGEPGYDDADQRLIDDAWEGGAMRMSYHYQSARDFRDRLGDRQQCIDIRQGCAGE